MADQPHVVVLGGGFGGLSAARALAGVPVRVTLVDRENHHLFQPLLYQVATAALGATEIAAPLRKIFRHQRNVTVLMDEATAIDPGKRRVQLRAQTLDYDYLIIASGASHNYFGRDEWQAHAPGLKTVRDALRIRARVLRAYEEAEARPDDAGRDGWMTFVVIGAGPTGVELAGAFAEIARHTLSGEFRRIDPARARILLLEAGERVLPPYPEALSEKARLQLEKLGVEVRTGATVTKIESGFVHVGEEKIPAQTIVWAAGVSASPLARSLGVPLDRAGRVIVEKDLSIPGRPEVFVIGDLARFEQDGAAIPGVAPAAIQQGRYVGAGIGARLGGYPPEPFRYVDKGSMATIGRRAAVAVLGRLRLSGTPAWLAWLFVHIFFLIGFRNRFIVLFEWALAYLAFQRNARLIIDEGDGDRR